MSCCGYLDFFGLMVIVGFDLLFKLEGSHSGISRAAGKAIYPSHLYHESRDNNLF
jgi:hypothetical protein